MDHFSDQPTPEIIQHLTNESLLQRRVELHHELGRLSTEAARIQNESNACLQHMVHVGEELRRREHIYPELSKKLWELPSVLFPETDEELAS